MFKILRSAKEALTMTKGEVKEIFGMSGPVLIEQLSVALMANLVSILVKGSGLAAVAAVNYLNSLTALFQQSYLAIGVGVTVVVAQYRGRKDSINAGKAAVESVILSVYLAVAATIGVLVFREPLLRVILANSEALVYGYARTYLCIYAFALPFIGIYTVASAAIRGSGYPSKSLIATLVYNGSYAVMAIVAVYVFHSGLVGVSYSLLISAVAAAVVGLLLLKRGNPNMVIEKLFKLSINRENIRPMMIVGFPIFLENLLFQSGRLITQTFVVSYGTDTVAVNGLANNVNQILCVPGTTCMNATPPIVGRYCGMRDEKNAKRKAVQFVLICMISMGITALIMMAILDPYARYYSSKLSVQAAIKSVVIFQCITMPLTWGLAFVGPSILRSSGDSKFTSFITVLAMFTMRIGVGYFCTHVLYLGVTGVWIGMFADWIFRGVFFLPRLLSGKWLKHDLFSGQKAAS